MLVVSDNSFQKDVLESSKPVLVDFWAPWCGPCKALTPILEEVAEELKDQIVLAKMNVDDHSQTPAQFGIRGIPTIILFKNGQPISTQVGLLPKGKIVEWVKSYL